MYLTRTALADQRAAAAAIAANHTMRAQRRQYLSTNMTRACLAVTESGVAIRCAARTYGVPYASLHDHLCRSGSRSADDQPHIGVGPALTDAEEQYAVQVLVHSAKAGFPLTVPQFQGVLHAQFPGRVDGRGLRWTASTKWVHAFLHRHHRVLRLRDCIPAKNTPAQTDLLPAVVQTYNNWNKFL